MYINLILALMDFSNPTPDKEQNICAGIENCQIRITINTKLNIIAGFTLRTTGILTIAGNNAVGFSRN